MVDKIGKKAFKIKAAEEEEMSDTEEENICKNLTKFHLDSEPDMYESDDSVDSFDSENPLSHTTSPPPDDTNRKLSLYLVLECWKLG